MLRVSGRNVTDQWLEYRPSIYEPIIRIEWPADTMNVILPSDVATHLIRHGYARAMTSQEITENPVIEEKET